MYMQNGHLNLVKFLIEKRADVQHANNQGETPLLIASKVCPLSTIIHFILLNINLTSQLLKPDRSFEDC